MVHLLELPGIGESHLAIAQGVEAVRAGHSVYFFSLANIVAPLAQAKREGRLGECMRFLSRALLLVAGSALLERLVHHARVVETEGSSYRLRQHVDLVPDTLRISSGIVTQLPPRRRDRPPKARFAERAAS